MFLERIDVLLFDDIRMEQHIQAPFQDGRHQHAEQEIEAVENYVYILNVRFAGEIHFTMELVDGAEDVQMPGMILQPIVENAVNHGIRNVEWDGYIHMKVEKLAEALKISIRDNGQGMTKERIQEVLEGRARSGEAEKDVSGIGIDNVINRLNLFFGQKELLQIYSDGPGTGTEVQVTIPYLSDERQKEGISCTEC